MSRILVASNDVLALNPHEAAVGKPYPPLSALVMSAQLIRAGHSVTLFDPMFLQPDALESGLREALERARPDAVVLAADDHAVHQKMCLSVLRDAMRRMVGVVKATGARVLVAGPDASTWPEAYRQADDVVLGDPAGVVVAWAAGERGIVGVEGAQGAGGRVPLIADLDALPDPAWELADLDRYKQHWISRHGYWELNVWTTRGCPYKCNWCAKPTWGRSYHARSPERVAAELERLRQTAGMDRIWFTDDIFALKAEWLRRFRDVLKHPVPYRCLSRVDLMKSESFTADLAATGCREVWVGAESGSDRVLAAMDKDSTVAEIASATALLRKHGVKICFFLQLGYPGETVEDVLSTVQMVRDLKPDEIGVSVSYPHPGTGFYARVAEGLKGQSWGASMDNKPLFEAPYRDAFYTAAKEVLRSEHSAGRAGVMLRGFLRHPDAGGARKLAGALFHRARLPWVTRRMRDLAQPNPRAVPLTW